MRRTGKIFLIAGLAAWFFMCEKSTEPAQNEPQEKTYGQKLIESKDKMFSMGSDSGSFYEKPAHNVSFTYSFMMDSTEVTQAMFDSVMKQYYGEYKTPNWAADVGLGPNFPVYKASWYSAALFCNGRSKMEGLDTVYTYTVRSWDDFYGFKSLDNLQFDITKNGFRLPTEAEYEFVLLGGTVGPYYWGAASPQTIVDEYEWSKRNADGRVHPVAQKKANPYGLYDSNGNLMEWVNDWFARYTAESVTDPVGPPTGDSKISKGCSWEQSEFRAVNRYQNEAYNCSKEQGFRTVRTLVE